MSRKRREREVKRTISEIRLGLARPSRNARSSGIIASLIVALRQDQSVMDESDVLNLGKLEEAFRLRLSEADLPSPTESLMDHAITIAEHPSLLLFEEALHLLSLCDNIYALKEFGIRPSPEMEDRFHATIQRCIHREKKNFSYAAQSTVEDWQRDLWWYVCALGKTSEGRS